MTGRPLLTRRPFAEGALLRRLKGVPVPAWAGELGCATWAQLLLKFVLGHRAVTCAIPATANAAHVVENLAAGSGWLPEGESRERIALTATGQTFK